jgi:hypothetical protein
MQNAKSSKYNFKLYQYIRENGGWQNWTMKIIKEVACNNKQEALEHERKFCDLFNGTLNVQQQTRTKAQWHKDNNERLVLKKKQKRENDETEMQKYKDYHHKHYQIHKEDYLLYASRYRVENREAIRLKQNKQITCPECQKEVSIANLARHKKSSGCIPYTK